MTIFEQLHIQANENLRATDAKRDRIFYLFVVIFGLFLNFYKDMANNNMAISIIAGSFLILLGITISFVLINYQIWHEVYVSSAIVLQKIIYRDISKNINNKTIMELMPSDSRTRLGYGASFYLFNSILIVNCVLITIVAYATISIIFPNYWITILTLILIAYILVFNVLYRISVRKAHVHILDISWLLKR